MKKIYPPSGSFDDDLIHLFKKDPKFADEYLRFVTEEATDEAGRYVLMKAIKQIAEARGMAKVAKKAGIPRQSLYRALSEKGNPRLDTFLAIIRGIGLEMTLKR